MGSFRGDELEQEDFTNGLEAYHRRLDEVERFGEWAGCRSVTRADENLPDENFGELDSPAERGLDGLAETCEGNRAGPRTAPPRTLIEEEEAA